MKRLIALLVLLTAACTSTSGRLPGRYALVIHPDLYDRARWGVPSPEDSIVQALRGRLQTFDLVSSRDVQGYDAVIVLSRGPSTRWNIQPPEPFPYSGTRIRLIHYEILRGGEVTSTGVARVESSWPVVSRYDIARGRTEPGSTHNIQQARAGGIEVARVVTQALRD